MKLKLSELKEGKIKATPENTEDLWHLEKVLSSQDHVFSKTWRRFKATEGEAGEKMAVNIELEAEKIEFSQELNRLRITGKIISGEPEEYAQKGQYHTIDVDMGFPITIKKNWENWQIDRLKEAAKESKKPKVRIVVLDDEKALFATLTGIGIKYDFEIDCHARKRDEKFSEKEKEYFGEILSKLADAKSEKIVVAGPGFTKDNLRKFILHKNAELLKHIIFDSVSYAERSGVQELLARGTISKAVTGHSLEQDAILMERFLEHLGKEDGLCAWGLEDVKKAIEYSAASEVLVLDSLLRKRKDVSALADAAGKAKVQVRIFSSDSAPGERLEGFGGLAAILRFRIG